MPTMPTTPATTTLGTAVVPTDTFTIKANFKKFVVKPFKPKPKIEKLYPWKDPNDKENEPENPDPSTMKREALVKDITTKAHQSWERTSVVAKPKAKTKPRMRRGPHCIAEPLPKNSSWFKCKPYPNDLTVEQCMSLSDHFFLN